MTRDGRSVKTNAAQQAAKNAVVSGARAQKAAKEARERAKGSKGYGNGSISTPLSDPEPRIARATRAERSGTASPTASGTARLMPNMAAAVVPSESEHSVHNPAHRSHVRVNHAGPCIMEKDPFTGEMRNRGWGDFCWCSAACCFQGGRCICRYCACMPRLTLLEMLAKDTAGEAK